MKILLAVLVLLGIGWFFWWLFAGNEPDTTIIVPPQTESADVEPGTYRGTLPCASCPGIDTTVALAESNSAASSGTYTMSELYIDEGDAPIQTSGTWIIERGTDKDNDATVYELTPVGGGSVRYFKRIDDRTLEALDTSGNEIDSDVPRVLVKIET